MDMQPIRIGVIGLGGRGRYLAEAFHRRNDAVVTAVCDLDPARMARTRERLEDPDVACETSHAALVARTDVDAVVVATHDQHHVEPGMAALRAGKHLFLEKPMAQTIEDCDGLIEAWRGRPVVFMIGLELRYCSLAQDMKRIIDRGDIGDIRIAYAVDNVSVGGQYFYHDQRRLKANLVNLLLQKGVHTLDLMNWWINAQPQRVYAEAGLDAFGGQAPNDKRCSDCTDAPTCPYFMPTDFTMDYGETVHQAPDLCVWAQEVDVEDNTLVTVRYDNGAKMTYVECHFTPDYNRHFTLIGAKGRIYGFYDNDQNFRIEVTYRHSGRRDVIHSEKRQGGHGGGDPGIQDAFIAHIRAGLPACPGVMGARNSSAIAIAAEEAVLTGMPVVVPPCPAVAMASEA